MTAPSADRRKTPPAVQSDCVGMPSTERQTQADQLRRLLQRVELVGQYQRAARARQTGEHKIELAALEHLSLVGGLTPGELGHRLGLSSGGVSALISRLMKADHVARARHPHDARKRIVTTTPAGEDHLERQIQPVLAAADSLLAWLAAEEAKLVEQFLDAVTALKEEAASATPNAQPAGTGRPYSPTLLM